jgi:uncharacterized protein DUF3631
MKRGRAIQRRFGDRERVRLGKLFRQIGTDNVHEAEAARSRIDSLLREFNKVWADLIQLLGSTAAVNIDADLARNIAALGSSDPDVRAEARRNIADLLARHRKNWNDLTDMLCASSSAAWASNAAAHDPPRVNPLDLVHYLLEQYVALEPHQYVAVALWCIHTHVFDRFMVTPRLELCSPVAGCGKTTLIDILSKLTAQAEKFDAITTAALYRLIDETHPTLLIDEADNLGIGLQVNRRLRAVFNSGHRSGGTLGISERGTTRKFSSFAPMALALPEMRGLPRTLNPRSISIRMERSQRKLKRFDANHPDPALDAAYLQIFLWRQKVELNPDPEMPVRNRFADNWRPLLSIADALDWGERARETMLKFAREYEDADAKILLLTDIRKVFDDCGLDRLSSEALLHALRALEAEWSEFRGARGDQQPHRLRATELATMLRDFAIRPHSIWPLNRTSETKSTKGYRRSQFEEAWARYCSDDDTPSPTNIRSLRVVSDGAV